MRKYVNGVYEIEQERNKHIHYRGYNAQHDDQHTGRELLIVALGLILNDLEFPEATEFCEELGRDQPWMKYIWSHPRPDNIKPLIVAGSLIAAEIDRLIRLRQKEQP